MKLSEFFKHDFKNGDFQLFDKDGRVMYEESKPDDQDPCGFWAKYIREDGSRSYMELSNGYCSKATYNEAGQMTSKECSDGYWWRKEYDSDGNEIFCICSDDKYAEIEDRIHSLDLEYKKLNPDYVPGSLRKIIIDLANQINRAKKK